MTDASNAIVALGRLSEAQASFSAKCELACLGDRAALEALSESALVVFEASKAVTEALCHLHPLNAETAA